jgi:DNA-binding transcriptional ArsR family regulator
MEYAKMPLEVFRDLRLSKNDLRVLAVLIFRSNEQGKCWPSLADISALSGLPKSRISEHTNRLKKFGLIDKKPREKGRNNQLIYTVFCQQSTSQVYTEPVYTDYTEPVYTDYTEPVYTTPITIKHKTLNIEKDVVSAKRISVFSKAEILSVKIPENLATEKGFISAWEKWIETKLNQGQKRNRFSDAKEVEEELQILAESFAEGLDIFTGLKTAARRKWIGFEKHYFHMRNNERKQKLSKLEEIDEAFDNFRKDNDENNGIRNERNSENALRSLPEFSGDSVYN